MSLSSHSNEYIKMASRKVATEFNIPTVRGYGELYYHLRDERRRKLKGISSDG